MLTAPNDRKKSVMSYARTNDEDKVFVVINFSDSTQKITFQGNSHLGQYKELFSGKKVKFKQKTTLSLEPHG